MKLTLLLVLLLLFSCKNHKSVEKKESDSFTFKYPEIIFVNQAPGTKGWEIYNRIIPNPEEYIKAAIAEVVQTLYWSDKDSIPDVRRINYRFRDADGISAKWGAPPEISIWFSSRWVEQSTKNGGDKQALFETRGVLLHELTHAYQLEPQGIGGYNDGGEFWIFIEAMADAVRIANGGFSPDNRKPGGNWTDGYRRTGYFLDWITATKDADFLRKFNRSTLDVVPWGFDKAIKHILGEHYCIDLLWEEYQMEIS
jgi:hypothetical protein